MSALKLYGLFSSRSGDMYVTVPVYVRHCQVGQQQQQRWQEQQRIQACPSSRVRTMRRAQIPGC